MALRLLYDKPIWQSRQKLTCFTHFEAKTVQDIRSAKNGAFLLKHVYVEYMM